MSSTTKDTLNQYKTETEKQLERQRAATKQAADINHQKLLKYLPQQTKGYSIGMTETAKIAANNAYQRQLAEADAAHADGMTELSNYMRQEQERLDDKKEAKQAERYNEIMSAVQNGEYNTTADLARYLGINESKGVFGEGSIAADLSDLQKANLLNMYQTRASDPAQVAADKEYKQTSVIEKLGGSKISKAGGSFTEDETGLFGWFNSSGNKGDNLEIAIGDDIYDVQRNNELTAGYKGTVLEAYKTENNGALPKPNEVFGFNNTLYIYFADGSLWSVSGRPTDQSDYSALLRKYYPQNEE